MTDELRIVIAEVLPADAELMERELRAAGIRFRSRRVTTRDTFLKQLEEFSPDLILCNHSLPGFTGVDALELAKDRLPTVPLIIVTSSTNEETAVTYMRAGAADYVLKENLARLGPVVEGALEKKRISESKTRTEEERARLATAIEHAAEAVVVTDTEGTIQYVNPAFESITGFKREEAVGQNARIVKSGKHHATFYKELWDSIKGGLVWSGHFVNKKKDGSLYEEEAIISPVYGPSGRIVNYVAVKRDVTDQRRTEEELRRTQRETEKFLTSMSSFLIEVGAGHCVLRWNTMAEETFGIAADQVVGKPFLDCGIDWDWEVISKQMNDWLSAEEPIRLSDIFYTRSDGTVGILGMNVNPVRGDDAEPSGFFLVGADITERKQLEAQLIQAQKLESIGQLAAGIAHEINTPTQYVGDNLRFLKGAFEDLRKLQAQYDRLVEAAKGVAFGAKWVTGVEDTAQEIDIAYLLEETPKAIEQSLAGIERVAQIVRAMKEFSHPGTEEKALTDLNRAIESTITVARNEWKYVADMETEFDPSLPPVSCLPGEFNQVILNIVINAAQAIADVVGDGSAGKGTITVATRSDSDRVEVRIRDTGTGIPDAVRPRIFDPFFTTKQVGKGTGQGLAIAHDVVVEKHGGTITFESELGKGTEFIIRLPVNPSSHEEPGGT